MIYRQIINNDTILEKTDDAIIICINSNIYLLNETASLVWNACKNAHKDQIIRDVKDALISNNVQFDEKTLINDIETCIQSMIDYKIISGD